MKLNETGRLLVVASLVASAVALGIFYGAIYAPQNFDNRRLTDCIHALADYHNSLRKGRDYGAVEFRYDRDSDRCLYRGNFIAADNGSRYFEKFITNAFTGDTLGEYAELDGIPIKGELAAFSTALDQFFPAGP